MQDIEFIKIELNNRNGNYRKLRFKSIEELGEYLNDKYQIYQNTKRSD